MPSYNDSGINQHLSDASDLMTMQLACGILLNFPSLVCLAGLLLVEVSNADDFKCKFI